VDTVLEDMQQQADVGWMIADAKHALDDLGDALAGPDLPAKAAHLRSALQERR
jgi:hypothetical protein